MLASGALPASWHLGLEGRASTVLSEAWLFCKAPYLRFLASEVHWGPLKMKRAFFWGGLYLKTFTVLEIKTEKNAWLLISWYQK